MVIISLIALGIVALSALVLIAKRIYRDVLENDKAIKKELRKKIKEQLKKIPKDTVVEKDLGKQKIKPVLGAVFDSSMECVVLDIFFHKDVKFAAIVPKISDKLLSVPGIVELSKDGVIIWDSQSIDEDVHQKAATSYKRYKAEHPDEFLRNPDGE